MLARSAAGAKELQSAIDQKLAQNYLQAGLTFQALERDEAAVELFSEALAHDPDSLEALQGRATSYSRLGESVKAAADKMRVSELDGES